MLWVWAPIRQSAEGKPEARSCSFCWFLAATDPAWDLPFTQDKGKKEYALYIMLAFEQTPCLILEASMHVVA